MDPIIRVQNVTKDYRPGNVAVPALRGVDVTVQPGEFIALVGPSGSGKSTLLNLLGGLDRPTAGDVTVAGQTITQLNDQALAQYRQKTVGMVFQSFNLLPHLTALQNATLPIVLAGGDPKAGAKTAEELLQRVGLGGRLHHRPSELSGGEQQRVALVRALVNAPRIILADEPTGNLDSQSGREVIALLTELCRQRQGTLVVVTHDEQVARAANRIIRLADGRVVDEGAAV